MEWLIELDKYYFHLINGSGSTTWDSLMLFASHKLSWIPLYILLIYLMIKEKGKESIKGANGKSASRHGFYR